MMTRSSLRAGFSLFEMMVVLTIIGLIVGFLVTNIPKRLEKGKKNATISTLKVLEQNINSFHDDTGHYPEQLQDLITKPANTEIAEKWDGPYITGKKVPTDGWNHAFHYQVTSDNPEHEYELYSNGSKKTKGPIRVSD